MRDIEKQPYSADEARVAKFFASRGIGGGDDPIGAMLAGYAWAVEHRNLYRKALESAPKPQSENAWVLRYVEWFKNERSDALAS